MAKFSNRLEFYEEKIVGGFEGGDPSCYKIEGEDFESVCGIGEVLWQAVEIDGFDNRKVLVKMQIKKDGIVVSNEKFHIETSIARTDVPSKFIVWGDKKPYIFEIDRNRSRIKIVVELPAKANSFGVTVCGSGCDGM